MIAKLTGTVDHRGDGHAVLDVGGVGYLVHCSARTLDRLPAPGGRSVLHVETQMREDRIQLYGFADAAERECFRMLLGVQGVGSRLALAILSALSPMDLARAVTLQDRTALGRAQGVGPRLAARLITELRDKLGEALSELRAMPPADGQAGAIAGTRVDAAPGVAGDAVSALTNLGYRPAEANAAVLRATANLGDGAPLEAVIRAGLRELAP